MSFGFLGIQFGLGLQMANMSAIYEHPGARPAQPIIGAMSDRTWCRLGRRRPYFLTGAILSSLAFIAIAKRQCRLDGGWAALDSRRVDQHGTRGRGGRDVAHADSAGNPAGLIACAEISSWPPFSAESRSLP